RFTQVLYTHQKTKKSKTWQDGILRVSTGRNKAVLFDDNGQCLESIFIKSQVNAGDNLEGERYLIMVEELKANEKAFEDQPRRAETSAGDRNGVKPGVLPPRHLSVGLKRKFTGFQVPRQVEKKISTVEDGENASILPLSKQFQGTFPSKFYHTSPLFSMIGKKDAEANPSAHFHQDVCVGNDTEHVSHSSLLSATFLGRCDVTEKPSSHQSLVKPESPLIPGQAKFSSQAAGHRPVSQNIRSTAQIIALLKSKPTQGCREEATSEVVERSSGFQASGNADGTRNQKRTVLPAFSGSPAKRLIENIPQLPSTEGTADDKKEWDAEVLLNSAKQLCDEEVTGQRHDKKVCNLSQDIQDPCNTNSCFLPEFTISRMSDSQFVPSSGDILCSASPVTLENNSSRQREHSVTDGLEENPSVELQKELQPRPNSGVLSDLEHSVALALPETGVGEDVAQSTASRCQSTCENKEVRCSVSGGEKDGKHWAEGVPSQLHDSGVGGMERSSGHSGNQTRTEAELLGDGHSVKEVNGSQLRLEATDREKDLDGHAELTIDGTAWIKNDHSDLLPSDTDVNECHPKTSMSEKTESSSWIPTSGILSAMDKRTEDDVVQLGCIKSPDVNLGHFWGTKSDAIQPGSPLLALSGKSAPDYGPFQCFAEDHPKVFGISFEEDSPLPRSPIYPLGKGHSSPEETAIDETELEGVESVNAFCEASNGERIGTDCLEHVARAQNSSCLPDLVNNIALLRALTQHSTALESLQQMEENYSVLCE
ncbi:ZGRF1 protein, partial [Centropus bengalensis]|nr:ZGRF1 protein [Centropus bengalensis]